MMLHCSSCSTLFKHFHSTRSFSSIPRSESFAPFRTLCSPREHKPSALDYSFHWLKSPFRYNSLLTFSHFQLPGSAHPPCSYNFSFSITRSGMKNDSNLGLVSETATCKSGKAFSNAMLSENLDTKSPENAYRRLEELNWENTFVDELPGDPIQGGSIRIVRNACYSLVNPSLDLDDPKLVAFSEDLAKLLDINPSEFSRPEIAEIFSGGLVLKGCKPYAQCYGGHQFGQWAGQLGDGRAITLGEIVNANTQQRWELQLKGAGLTPYSRRADGKAVLRSSVREFLASEALYYLGVPTTRALTLTTTGEKVMRDMFYNGNIKFEPGAVVCRVAPSFLRFGSFQIYASRGGMEAELAHRIADYAIKYHFPHLAHLPSPDLSSSSVSAEGDAEIDEVDESQVDPSTNKYIAWFAEVAERTGRLVAMWQAFGFTHGVLNTDNMSILGLTIDFGPFGFMDAFDPKFTPNTSDLPGRRYCFQNQPDIGLWNIVQLANALHSVKLLSVPEAQYCVSRYAETFLKEYESRMKSKLGLKAYNRDQTQSLLKLMAAHSADFTILFRNLASVPASAGVSDDDLFAPLLAAFAEPLDAAAKQAWCKWLRIYTDQVREEGRDPEERKEEMNSSNPVYVLRNYLCQIAIEAAEKGDFSEVQALLEVMKNPFTEQEGKQHYAKPPPEWAKKPGVCMLSCSS